LRYISYLRSGVQVALSWRMTSR